MANKGKDKGTYYYHGDHLASSNSVNVPRHELIQRKSALKSTEQKCKSEQFYCSEVIHDITGENYGHFCFKEEGTINECD